MTVRVRRRRPKEQLEREVADLNLDLLERQLLREQLMQIHPRVRFALSRHITHKGEVLEFVNHQYLLPLYLDDCIIIYIEKPSQMGVSEFLLVRTFEGVSKGLSTFYVLPKIDLRNKFVKTRVNPCLEQSTYYQSLMGKDKEGSVGVKKFKGADVALVGANKDTEMISFVADQAIIDEVNFCDPRHVEHARKRLRHSEYKYEIHVSTPTTVGRGIDALFKLSDMKHWFTRCGACGERQPLDFFKNVVRGEDGECIGRSKKSTDLGVWCKKCERELNRLGKGEYVKEREQEVSGYHIPALCSPLVSIKEIWNEYQKAKHNQYTLQLWFNNDLGMAYTAKGARLTDVDLDNCVGEYLMEKEKWGDEGITAGVDVGAYLHIRISKRTAEGKRQALVIDKLRCNKEGVQALIDMIRRYNVVCCVIDAAPERKTVEDIKEEVQGVVWSCEYSLPDKTREVMRLHEDDMGVSVNRTWSIDNMVADVRLKRLLLPADAQSILDEEYYDDMKAPTRILTENDKGEQRYVWEEGSQADHFFHAENYDCIAGRILDESYGTPNCRVV